jgi:hypothetical protein
MEIANRCRLHGGFSSDEHTCAGSSIEKVKGFLRMISFVDFVLCVSLNGKCKLMQLAGSSLEKVVMESVLAIR